MTTFYEIIITFEAFEAGSSHRETGSEQWNMKNMKWTQLLTKSPVETDDLLTFESACKEFPS